MKYLLPSTLVLAAVLIFLNTDTKDQQSIPQKFDEKHEPYDVWMQQRISTGGKFSIDQYHQALNSIKKIKAEKDDDRFDEPWIEEGPGNYGGRVNTIAVDPQNEAIIYLGYSSGGIFKTTNGGQDWNPIFDNEITTAIGAIAIDPNNSNIVYAGTGDPNISGYPLIGNGIYKSIDGGLNWEHMGLSNTRTTARIVIDPSNTNIIFAATMGLPFALDDNRGLYRSLDGGLSWEQVLFLDSSAGVVDVVMNKDNPNILYASGWNRIRNNVDSEITGPSATVWKSIDGGDNWEKLTNGLPSGDLGRTGLTISESNPNQVYAMYVGVNSQMLGLWESNDAGASWQELSLEGLNSNALGGFGWYFGQIRLNPYDENEIYLLGVHVWRYRKSDELWQNVSSVGGGPHVDHHDMQFAHGKIYVGTDGGAYQFSGGDDLIWQDIENNATTQFYRISYNPHSPDEIAAGSQDNGTVTGNATNFNSWPKIGGGDGFQTRYHPTDPNIYYTESQRGVIRTTKDGGDTYSFLDLGLDPTLDRNWDMPYLISPHNPEVLYCGTNRVHRIEDNVPNPFWNPISDTLATSQNTVFLPNISALDESSLQEGFLYVGTIGGSVWRRINETADFELVSANLPEAYVTDVKTSPNFLSRAVVTHSRYRDNDDTPLIHYTQNFGQDWEDISGDLPQIAINDVLIMPGYQDSVIFVATDGALFGTVDRGNTWSMIGNNLPIVPIYDVEYNPITNTLWIGTFARSTFSFPLDGIDLSPNLEVANRDQEIISFSIFPNPSSDRIEINAEAEVHQISFFDASGKLVKDQPLQSGALQIDISELKAGIYFVSIETDKGRVQQKLIVN